jgi:hypothetical protein
MTDARDYPEAYQERRVDSTGREIKSNRAWREEAESLRQQLAEVIDECGEYACANNGLKLQLAESRAACDEIYRVAAERTQKLYEGLAREKVLRDFCQVIADKQTPWSMQDLRELLTAPSDSTALEQAKLAAKREALLEAANSLPEDGYYGTFELRRMAEEMK